MASIMENRFHFNELPPEGYELVHEKRGRFDYYRIRKLPFYKRPSFKVFIWVIVVATGITLLYLFSLYSSSPDRPMP
jgi:hypothetical protein